MCNSTKSHTVFVFHTCLHTRSRTNSTHICSSTVLPLSLCLPHTHPQCQYICLLECVAAFCWLLCMLIASYCTHTHTYTHTLYVCADTFYRDTVTHTLNSLLHHIKRLYLHKHILTHRLHHNLALNLLYCSLKFHHRHRNRQKMHPVFTKQNFQIRNSVFENSVS